MFINFARKMFELLISEEFSYIKQENNTLNYDTEALSLYKDKGSVLYVVSIINGLRLDKESYENIISKYSALLDDENNAQVILMNIIADDNDRLLEIEEDFLPGKKSYIFTYNVSLETGEVNVNELQPDLLGIEALVSEASHNYDENYINGTHLTSLQKELSKKYSLPVKSVNSLLTFSLIGLNILVWLLMETSGSSTDGGTLTAFGAITGDLVRNQYEYYRLISSIFLHIGVFHLINNCLALYIFGARVERYFGKFFMITLYLAAGTVGNLLTIYFIPNLSVGASGAIFGLLGVILSVSYRTGRSVGQLSPYIIVLLCVYSVGMGFVMPGVNNIAHIGGFVVGILTGGLMKIRAEYVEHAKE